MKHNYERTLEDNQKKIKIDKAGNKALAIEHQNLALGMDDYELMSIGAQVMADFKTDDDSRAEWIDMHDDWLRLYFQKDTPINRPWEGSSEESIPILAEAVNQTSSRFKKAFFPGRDRIIKAIPVAKVSEEDIERADRISYHMSWQCMVKNRSYRKDKRRLLHDVSLHGSCFTKTWWDPDKNMWVVNNVRAVDLVVPYGRGSRELEDIERKTEIIWMSVNQTRKKKQTGYFRNTGEPYTRNEGQDEAIKATTDSVDGLNDPVTVNSSTPAKLLEQHRNLDLDKDGIEEPYIVTIDAETEEVLRISQRWDEADPKKEPVEYYTHYYFMENPDGFYGLGFGHQVGSPNKAVNKMLRQGIDAGTLANANTGFISEQLGIRGGEIGTTIGQFKKINASASDMKNGIFKMDHSGPNAGLIQLMELVSGRADRLAMVTDSLTGQMDKVVQPTTILALVEQGLQQFTASLEGLVDAWSLELEKIYRLNGKYLDEVEYFAVLDAGPQTMFTGRADYAADLQIMPLADPKQAMEQQVLTRAEAEWQFANQNPLINPFLSQGQAGDMQAFYESSKRYLEALNIKGIDKILPNPQQKQQEAQAAEQEQMAAQQQQTMAGQENMPAKQENFFALLPVPQVPQVKLTDDHMQHLAEHTDFMNDPQYGGTAMTPEGLKQMEDHIQMHGAMMYGRNEANMDDIFTPEGEPPLKANIQINGAAEPGAIQ